MTDPTTIAEALDALPSLAPTGELLRVAYPATFTCQCEHTAHQDQDPADPEPVHTYGEAMPPADAIELTVPGLWRGMVCRPCVDAGHVAVGDLTAHVQVSVYRDGAAVAAAELAAAELAAAELARAVT